VNRRLIVVNWRMSCTDKIVENVNKTFKSKTKTRWEETRYFKNRSWVLIPRRRDRDNILLLCTAGALAALTAMHDWQQWVSTRFNGAVNRQAYRITASVTNINGTVPMTCRHMERLCNLAHDTHHTAMRTASRADHLAFVCKQRCDTPRELS